ncbi:MAG: CDP-diacylglycerol--glycerol-3-phosphate 3-phosphatidyltransferase [Thermodesulfobacteriota bacterium]
MTEVKDKRWNIPNLLSFFRIGIVPILIIILLSPGRFLSLLAAVLFFVASLTDLLDGYIARKFDISSSIGKALDPLADKILVSTCLIMLVSLDRAPAWITALIIGREIAIMGLRGIAASESFAIEVSRLAKYKTFFQTSAVTGLIIHYPFFNIDFQSIGEILLWIAFVLTIWSGTNYLLGFLKNL